MKNQTSLKKTILGNTQILAILSLLFLLISITSLDTVNALTSETDFGSGSDGDLTVVSGQTAYTDTVKSSLAVTTSAGGTQLQVSDISGFAAGQEVLIMQITGTQAGYYEFAFISSISSNTIHLESPLANIYSVGGSTKAQVIRVPHFQNVTVQSSGIITAQPWNGSTGGVLIFRALGNVVLENGSSLQMIGAGYRGANNQLMSRGGNNGESTDGFYGMGGGVGQYGNNGGGSGSLIFITSPRGYRSGGGGGGTYDHTSAGQGDEGSGGGGGGGHFTAGGGGGGGGDSYAFGGVGGSTSMAGNIGGGNGAQESLDGSSAGSQPFGYTGTGGNSWSSPDRGTGAGGGGSSSSDSIDGSIIMMGSGGGQGGHYRGRNNLGAFYGSKGGDGGGIIMVFAKNLTCLGNGCLNISGENGGVSTSQAGSGGGGAGGYLFIRSMVLDIGSDFLISGGGAGGVGTHGASGDGGHGGYGRVRLEYCESFSGSTNTFPSLQKVTCVIPTPTPTYTPSPTNTPEPSPTPTSTYTPEPSPTPAATNTPVPTSTPAPSSAVPIAIAASSYDSEGNLRLDGSLSYDTDGNITTYLWSVVNGSTFNGMIVSVTSWAPGTYEVTLTVTDNTGLTNSDTMVLLIDDHEKGRDWLDKPAAKLRSNPVGTEDEVYGDAVPGSTILIYSDENLTDLIAITGANGDGRINVVGVGDNEYTVVYVIARDDSGRTSKARALKNDLMPPIVVKIEPEYGEENVRRNTMIVITFSEFMDEELTISAFSIDGGITGTLRVDGKRLIFTPDGLLEPNTTYTVIISAVAADEAGNPIGIDLVYSFTTGNKPSK